MPDETPLWQLLQNQQYDALQAGIDRMRASHGKWQPPQELLSLLQQGRLRQKIEQDAANPQRIVTVRGGGYRFEG